MTSSKLKSGLDSLLIFAGICFSSAIAVYAYLGIFARHMADDYCAIKFTRSNFFSALWTNYLNISDRYSNFTLIALSEFISTRSVRVLPALMLILWVVGITWSILEVVKIAKINWPKPLAFVLASMLIFFTLLQAPNLYQTLYWRSSMATHFAPLVFAPYFLVYVLRRISSAMKSPAPFGYYLLDFALAFLLGGFSEPTVVVLIALFGSALLGTWFLNQSPNRTLALSILTSSFMGFFAALLAMVFAPANALRLGTPPPPIPLLISRSFLYAFQFSLNSLRTLALPAFLTLFISFFLFYGLYVFWMPKLTSQQTKTTAIILIILPVFSYLLIVASFSPSVYGQGFPIERARFIGQLILDVGLMSIGAYVGVLLAQWTSSFAENLSLKIVFIIVLLVLCIYPVRAAVNVSKNVSEYQARAKMWDLRNDYIVRHAALGEQDLIVPGYSGAFGIKELDDSPNQWINLCAASYYQVNSISALSIPDQYIVEYLNK
ncbi:MAG: DUF6056 family protein [Anaerolineales bacterium]